MGKYRGLLLVVLGLSLSACGGDVVEDPTLSEMIGPAPKAILTDDGNDGTVNTAVFITRDNDQFAETIEYYDYDTGSERVTVNYYNSAGLRTETTAEQKTVEKVEYYDENGISLGEFEETFTDSTATKLYYDEKGRKIREEFTASGPFVPGSQNYTVSFEYDDYLFDILGLPAKRVYDHEKYGTTVLIRNYFAGSNDLIEKTIHDDGRQSIKVIQFDDNLKRVKEIEDHDNDGIYDHISWFEWDSNGQPIEERTDHDADGFIDVVFQHAYDERGNQVSFVVDEENDGIIDHEERSKFNKNNKLFEEYMFTRNYDGHSIWIDEEIRYIFFDSQGRDARVEFDENVDGTIDAVRFYRW